MLEPEARRLLLDALRPPVGYELDRAVGTTYTLDLISLLAAPLGFAMLDRESPEGRVVADPMALLEAVRRYADRIDIFCQNGAIGVPAGLCLLLTYLESSIHEVNPPQPGAIFHPKVWTMRYRRMGGESDGTEQIYRVLCLSRNMTFDQSWDTVLSLDGQVSGETSDGATSNGATLASFIASLPGLAARSIDDERSALIRELSGELRSVTFVPPTGFDRVAFFPLGLGGEAWPFPERLERLVVISPFLTDGCLSRLSRCAPIEALVSRRETFDRLGADALAGIGQSLVLNPLADSIEAQEDSGGVEAALLQPDAGVTTLNQLRGLHAKLYVGDEGRRARVWTGSANATDAAFGYNVEFLVQLEGSKELCGVDALMGHDKEPVGLGKLLESYLPDNETAQSPTVEEELQRELDRLARTLSRQAFTARVTEVNGNGNEYRLTLELCPRSVDAEAELRAVLAGAVVRARPLTLDASRSISLGTDSVSHEIDFGVISFASLTSFFVLELAMAHESGAKASVSFVVNVQLIGAPADRMERVLVLQLANKGDLLRYLLLLLDGAGWPGLGGGVDLRTGSEIGQSASLQLDQWHALLEPLVHALGRDPVSLDAVNRIIEDMKKSDDGRKMIPDGLQDIWAPIWAARVRIRGE